MSASFAQSPFFNRNLTPGTNANRKVRYMDSYKKKDTRTKFKNTLTYMDKETI